MSNDKQSGSFEDKSKHQGGSGNFANDPQRASEAGKKGGQASHGGASDQSSQSGSGRSQQGGGRRDDTDDSDDSESGRTRGADKDQR
jgi:uncharacterized protein